jgi:hypothetical protein
MDNLPDFFRNKDRKQDVSIIGLVRGSVWAETALEADPHYQGGRSGLHEVGGLYVEELLQHRRMARTKDCIGKYFPGKIVAFR